MLLALRAFAEEGFGPDAGTAGGGPVRTHSKGKARGARAARGKLGPPAERAWAEAWRTKLKIAGVRLAGCGRVGGG
jgi:histone acetyltransferase 1